MAAAVIGTVPAVVKDTNGGVTAVTMPTHRAGDLIVIGVVSRSTTGISADGGFAEVFEGSTTNPHCALYAKVAVSAAETCNITAGADDDVIQAARFAYHSVRAGFEATDILKGTEATATSATFDPPNLSFGSTLDAMVLVLAGFAWTNAADAITSGPSGYTTVVNDKSAASTTSVGIYMGWKDSPQASSENPGQGANTSRVWRAQTFYIPASVAQPTWIEDFTAADATAFNGYNGWVGSQIASGATGDILSNKLRLISGTADPAPYRGIQYLPNSDGIWYGELTYPTPVTAGAMVIQTRAAGNWNNAGYSSDSDIALVMDDISVQAYRDDTGAQLATAVIAPTAASTWAMKGIVLGTTVRIRVWDRAGAESAAYQIETTSPAVSSGNYMQIRNANTGGGAITSLIDVLRFYDLSSPFNASLRTPSLILPSRAAQQASRW